MLTSARQYLARDIRGAANPKLVLLMAALTFPVAGGYALGYDVIGDALSAFNGAVSGVMRMIGV